MLTKEKIKFLFIAALIGSAAFITISHFYFIPAFTKSSVKNFEQDAIQIASHLSTMIVSSDGKFNNLEKLNDMTLEVMEIFAIEKIKLFSNTGTVLYSTHKEDVGKINNDDYFFNKVAKGNIFSKLIEKDKKTLEGRVVFRDVMETYVPLIHEGEFVGAFELYLDVTDRKQVIKSLIIKFIILVMSFFLLLLIAFTIIVLREDTSFDRILLPKKFQSKYYTLIIIALTLVLTEMFIMHVLLPMFGYGSTITSSILDSLLILIISAPVLFYFIYSPMYQLILAAH
ncbi:MAG: hypothetical protein V3V59_08235, partial [Thermodesulfovibrionales bacterium]